MEKLFSGIFDSELQEVIKPSEFLLVLAVALIVGVLIALAYTFRSRYTKGFVITLALLPAVVSVVIMMVNGNIGAGVAVAGAFSLVRFRSVPGTAKEIGMIFLAMGAGLVTGMGYLAYSVLFTVVIGAAFVLYSLVNVKEGRGAALYKTLTVTVPEDLNYSGIFEEILKDYVRSYELTRVKTTNMGSMFKLTFSLVMRADADEKEMIDKIRVRNGNLEVSLARQETVNSEL